MTKRVQIILFLQATYYLVTALWGLLHIESFMQVTGPKTDIWLVKTVSVLLLPISVCFYYAMLARSDIKTIAILAIGCTIGLAVIEFYYTVNGTIKWVYAVDGAVQVVFLLLWVFVVRKFK